MECHRFAYADLDCLILSSPSVKYEALYPAQPLLFSRTEPAPQVASEIIGGTMSTDEPWNHIHISKQSWTEPGDSILYTFVLINM